jgi:hypothetical protein
MFFAPQFQNLITFHEYHPLFRRIKYFSCFAQIKFILRTLNQNWLRKHNIILIYINLAANIYIQFSKIVTLKSALHLLIVWFHFSGISRNQKIINPGNPDHQSIHRPTIVKTRIPCTSFEIHTSQILHKISPKIVLPLASIH